MSDREPPYRHPLEERAALGARLKKIREENGHTLRSLADSLTERGYPIGFGAIGHWETGKNVPDALWLWHLARTYGMPVDVLLSDEHRQAVELLANVTKSFSVAPSPKPAGASMLSQRKTPQKITRNQKV